MSDMPTRVMDHPADSGHTATEHYQGDSPNPNPVPGGGVLREDGPSGAAAMRKKNVEEHKTWHGDPGRNWR